MVGVIDLSGQRIFHLVALSQTDERRYGQVLWRCRCDCGKYVLVPSAYLRRGKIKTCGCPVKDFHRELTQDYLKEILDYESDSGVFRWKKRSLGCVPGAVAGTHVGRGYMRVRIHGVNYFLHRLAWFYVYGMWPSSEIDHKDRDARNNRINNLRECESSSNAINKASYSNNTSGFKGVTWHKSARKWMAQIDVRKRHIYLGLYDTAHEAAQAYDSAALEHYGEFAYLNSKDVV